MREYEFTIITKSDLPETDKAKLLEGYENILKRGGGEVLKREEWGTKRMTYPIKKQFRGSYVFYDLTSTAPDIEEAERLLRLDDNILRYLVVKIDDDVNIEDRKAALIKAAAQLQQQQEAHHHH